MNSDDQSEDLRTHFLRPTKADALPDRATAPLDRQIPAMLELHVTGAEAPLRIAAREYLIVGRRERPGVGEADIDLTPYDAMELGVSRQHVVISVRPEGVTIKDLKSTNGTFLNGFALKPLHAYKLRHGDQLVLGRLGVLVVFVAAPVRPG